MTKDERQVSEKDLFDFVFHRSALPADMIREIENNPSYKDRINHYLELREVTEEDDLDDIITAKLARRISAFKPEPVELLPVSLQHSNTPTLPHSFMDPYKKYYACVEENVNCTKIYLFSPLKKVIQNYSLTIVPSGRVIKQQNNLTPATITKETEIDKITLEFD